MKVILNIFITFMKIGAFSFGGGLAMLPFIEKEMVYNHHWITSNEFVDIIAIAQMTPGPIAINSSTFVGYKAAGVKGALAGSIGVVITSFVLITILAKYFMKIKDARATKAVFKGIRPAVLGLILSAAISIGKTALIDFNSIIIAVIVFFSLKRLRFHPILGIVLAGVLGVVLY
ncbi:chromate transporter [Crassaminicella thermophila]|uniref:Chromate transporter n=1 Tax=Crassaminicella thermophila TaxID=2599308 RepID=A0A5C0SIV9_CRATE|nr:chromate transporter [Crassaminicella thermophila]QEK12889.1 chromate transporter [Crassaminicella thermophila]